MYTLLLIYLISIAVNLKFNPYYYVQGNHDPALATALTFFPGLNSLNGIMVLIGVMFHGGNYGKYLESFVGNIKYREERDRKEK